MSIVTQANAIDNVAVLAIEQIRTDGGTQSRSELSQDKITEYAQLMFEGTIFPPVVTFYDGTDYWLADGFHRYRATEQICRETIGVDIRQGTRREAVLYAMEANTRHGIPLPLSDRKRCAQTLVDDAEWSQMSDREIGRRCGIDGKTVAAMRPKKNAEIPQSDVVQPVETTEAVDRVGNSPSIDERRKTVEDFIASDPQWREMSYRAIAKICGVDHKTVASIIKEMFPDPEPKPDIVPGVGVESEPENVEEPTTKPPLEEEIEAEPIQTLVESTAHVDNIPLNVENTSTPEPEEEPTLGSEQSQEAESRQEEATEEVTPIVKSASLTALQSSESNEWYTPALYVNAARNLMGGIEVDPASNEVANKVIRATTYYDIEANGLDKPWFGRVWLNPPYGTTDGKSNQEIWTNRLIEQYDKGNGPTKEAVLLVNANTEAKWFQPLYNYLICFTDHRIHFYNTEGDSNQPTQGNALVYFGKQRKRFIELFSYFGTTVERAK